jgi:hypothetical protein
MRKNYFIPRKEALLILWISNFRTQLAIHGAALGFSPAEISAVVKFCAAYQYMLEVGENVSSFLKEWVRYKQILVIGDPETPLGAFPTYPVPAVIPSIVPAGGIRLITNYAQRIKKHPDYNNAIGKLFGIIGTEKNIDFSMLRPKASVKESISNHVALCFTKKSMEGVIIYSIVYPAGIAPPENFETITGWQNIAKVNHSPYFDIRPNKSKVPELRLYKLVYFMNDKIVGKESEIIKVMAEVYVDQDGNEMSSQIK